MHNMRRERRGPRPTITKFASYRKCINVLFLKLGDKTVIALCLTPFPFSTIARDQRQAATAHRGARPRDGSLRARLRCRAAERAAVAARVPLGDGTMTRPRGHAAAGGFKDSRAYYATHTGGSARLRRPRTGTAQRCTKVGDRRRLKIDGCVVKRFSC